MGMEFGWWSKNEEVGKFQICVEFHGGKVIWMCKQGHFNRWEPFQPDDEAWERLQDEAARRVPRRLMSPKQFAELERVCKDRGPCEKYVVRAPRLPGSK